MEPLLNNNTFSDPRHVSCNECRPGCGEEVWRGELCVVNNIHQHLVCSGRCEPPQSDHQMAQFSPEAKMPAFANGFYFAEIVSITKPIGLSPLEIVFNNWLRMRHEALLPVFSPPWYTVVHTAPGWPTGVKMPTEHPCRHMCGKGFIGAARYRLRKSKQHFGQGFDLICNNLTFFKADFACKN